MRQYRYHSKKCKTFSIVTEPQAKKGKLLICGADSLWWVLISQGDRWRKSVFWSFFSKRGNGSASATYWQKASNLGKFLAKKERFAMVKKGKIYEELLVLADAKNAGFVQRLIPNLAPERILGTKTPILRTFAKQLAKRMLVVRLSLTFGKIKIQSS